jgi:LysR family transcriptional regulator, low CO2-responsive transcriptional regulator
MTLHQLKVFATVAAEGSFSQAAKKLFISQPSVSYQVRELEREVKTELFEQTGRRIHLTQPGETLFGYAQQILTLMDDATRAMHELRGLERGALRVGASSTAGIYILPAILGAFKHRYPQVDIAMDIAAWPVVRNRLLQRQIDLAVVGEPSREPELEIEPFLGNELVVIAPPDHHLVGAVKVPLATLAQEPFLIREPTSGTRLTLERLMDDRKISLRVAMELGSNGAIKQAVEAGLGVAVLSQQAIQLEVQAGKLRVLDIEGFPIHRQWNIVRLKARRPSIPAAAFEHFLKSLVEERARAEYA